MSRQADVHRAFNPPLSARLGEAWQALAVLRQEVGLHTALAVLVRAAAAVGPLQVRLTQQARSSTAEMAVVDQAICWSIAIYQALLPVRGQARALVIMERLVVASGQRLMAHAFPPLDGDALEGLRRFVLPAMAHAERHGLYELANISPEGAARALSFDVTYCRYVELCQIADALPLASCFCAVDRPFFRDLCPDLELSCPERLAAGDHACTFSFRKERGAKS